MSLLKRSWVVLLALSIGLNAGLLLSGRGERAKPPGGPNARGPAQGAGAPDLANIMEHHLDRISTGLELTGDQKTWLKSIYDELFPAILERHRLVQAARRDVGEHYLDQNLDPADFRERVHDLQRAQAELDSLVTETMLREAEVLTVEQRRRYVIAMPWGRQGGAAPSGPGDRRGPPRGPGMGDRRGPPPEGMPDGPPPGGPPTEQGGP